MYTPGTFPDNLASYSITSPNTIVLHLMFPPPSLLAEADLRGLSISASSIASLQAFAQAAAKGTVEHGWL